METRADITRIPPGLRLSANLLAPCATCGVCGLRYAGLSEALCEDGSICVPHNVQTGLQPLAIQSHARNYGLEQSATSGNIHPLHDTTGSPSNRPCSISTVLASCRIQHPVRECCPDCQPSPNRPGIPQYVPFRLRTQPHFSEPGHNCEQHPLLRRPEN